MKGRGMRPFCMARALHRGFSLLEEQAMRERELDKSGQPIGPVDPAAEDAYWRGAHTSEPYYKQGTDFERYAPAYRVGYLGRVKYDGRTYNEIEDELAADYERFQGNDM